MRREEDVLTDIVCRLSATHGWCYNTVLPNNILILDIETLGFNADRDAIVQYGACAMIDGVPCDTLWPGDKYLSTTIKWPADRFKDAADAVKVHGIGHEKSAAEGVEPKTAFQLLYDIVEWGRSEKLFIGGHNFFKFDRPFIEQSTALSGVPVKFENKEILDTAALVKAMQIGMIPEEGEPAWEFYSRVATRRAKGVYFNLDRYCVGRFGLDKKYGVSKDSAHDAGYDCYLTSLVFLEMCDIVKAVMAE